MKVVLDTNVIISAFLWARRTSQILNLVEDQNIIVYTCSDQIRELKGVLERPKFKLIFKKAQLKPETIVSGFLDLAQLTKPIKKINIIKDDLFDNIILSCAMTIKAKYLITGDKHLLSLKEFQKTKIIKPAEFLEKYK